MGSHSRLVPLVVASPLFLQNVDTSAMATALPSMAASLQVPTLHLNLVVTAYLVSIAVFLPLSAWLAERFGPRRMFCTAIVLFSASSALSGLAASLPVLVACRVLQGLGAAMMLPVGRLILLRSVPAAAMIGAMTWFTVPPVMGRMMGPLIGGAVLSVASWHWIFFVNVPLGLLAVVMTLVFVKETPPEAAAPPFDLRGFVLVGLGLAMLLAGLETFGKHIVPLPASAALLCGGLLVLAWYVRRSRGMAEPVLDLGILRVPTYRTHLLGAVPLRLALFGVPFLLPLMLQLGFGHTPLMSGLLASAAGAGALCTRGFLRLALGRFGFRRLLLMGTAATAFIYMGYALFRPSTPVVLIFAMLFTGGLLSSFCMVSLNTLAFIEVPKARMSHATALSSVAQQLTSGGAVVLAGLLLSAVAALRHPGGPLAWQDFSSAFVMLGLIALFSLLPFRRLPADVGGDLR